MLYGLFYENHLKNRKLEFDKVKGEQKIEEASNYEIINFCKSDRDGRKEKGGRTLIPGTWQKKASGDCEW